MIAMESILSAWDEFKKGKREKRDVQEFEYRLEDNLFALHRELIEKQYRHHPYRAFYIQDPKVRLIHKAIVKDRIVHHLLYRSLNPIFEETFIFDSYSCRKNKGTHRAVRRLADFTRKVFQTNGKCFVLKCDVKQFFPSINQNILLQLISRRIKDQETLRLVRIIITSFSATPAPRERERERVKGARLATLPHNFSPMFISMNSTNL